jgi:hypothetical protein
VLELELARTSRAGRRTSVQNVARADFGHKGTYRLSRLGTGMMIRYDDAGAAESPSRAMLAYSHSSKFSSQYLCDFQGQIILPTESVERIPDMSSRSCASWRPIGGVIVRSTRRADMLHQLPLCHDPCDRHFHCLSNVSHAYIRVHGHEVHAHRIWSIDPDVPLSHE